MIFYTHERNFGCRVTEYVYRGLRTFSMENESLRVTVLADKGGDIIEFLHYTSIVDELNALGWQTHMMRTGKRGRFDGASDRTIYSNPAYLIYR
ncbi:MAG: hypothetical protein OHK0015_08650 [Chloroflexi bacterium OHK40]